MLLTTSWEDLAIRDNYLFQHMMRNKRLCKGLLEKILNIKIHDISYPETEKQIASSPLSKSVRLDVYVEDDAGTIYNVEMQTTGASQPAELAKRTRYYGAQIDMSCIGKGQDYEELPKTFIIFICTFDPFKHGKSIYTFRRRCDEDLRITMGDETTIMFLCTNGAVEGVDPDIISFLRYVDGKEAEGAFTKEIDAAIKEIKEHAEVRREYMTLELELRREVKKRYAEGIAIGREEGREEGVISALRNLINRLGLSSEKAMDALDIPAADRAKYAALLRN